MQRIRKYAAILTVSAILLIIGRACYVQRDSHRPTSGTANTIAELREQTPIDDYFSKSELSSIPEPGPFHWERYEDSYIIRGKPNDPREFANWFTHGDPELTEDLLKYLDSDEVTRLAFKQSSVSSFGFLSDGSFEIGVAPSSLSRNDQKLPQFVSDPIAIGLFVVVVASLAVLVLTIRRKSG